MNEEEKDHSNTSVFWPKCLGPPLDEVSTDNKVMSLGPSPVSLEVCACNFVPKKVKNGRMLMVKLYIFICLIKKKNVIIVLPLKEEAVSNGIANGQNTGPESVTSGMF